MKKNLLPVFLICSLGLNAIFAWKLFRNNPTVVSNWSTDDLNITPRSVEELSFVREFLSRTHTFQSSSYLSSQASLLSWLSEDLMGEKKNEIQRISKKLQDQNVDQTAQLFRLEQNDDGSFFATNSVALTEGKTPTHFFVEDSLTVIPAIRSSENVWGFQVARLTSKVISSYAPSKEIKLAAGKMTLLQFPCQAKNVSDLATQNVKMKVVTTKTSEISLVPDPLWNESLSLLVSCETKEYRLQISPGFPIVRFLKIDEAQGTLIPQVQKRIPKERNLIRKSLEKELGFTIEESDK